MLLLSAFAIHVREQNGDRHKIYVSVLPSQNYSIGGLSPGRQYEIYVTAQNRFGESAASATIKIITDQTGESISLGMASPQEKKKSSYRLHTVKTVISLPSGF